MQLHLSFLLIQQMGMYPEAELWTDDDISMLSVPAGAGAVELDSYGGCWYRTWDRTHGVSHEEELEHLSENRSLQEIVTFLRHQVDEIDKRYDWPESPDE